MKNQPVTDSINNSATVIANSAVPELIVNILAPIIIGGLIGWFLNMFFSNKKNTVDEINEHIDEIKNFSFMLYDYWCIEPNDYTKNGKSYTLSKKNLDISTSFSGFGHFYSIAKEKFSKNNYDDYQDIMSQIYNEGLGDGFETTVRGSVNPEQAKICAEKTIRLIYCLKKAREEQHKLITPFKRFFCRYFYDC